MTILEHWRIINGVRIYDRLKLDGKVNKIRKGNGDEKGLKRGERIETFLT